MLLSTPYLKFEFGYKYELAILDPARILVIHSAVLLHPGQGGEGQAAQLTRHLLLLKNTIFKLSSQFWNFVSVTLFL